LVTEAEIRPVLEILVPLFVVGAPVAWLESRLYYWDPAYFRNGLRILHRTAPTARALAEIPLPSARGRILGWKVESCRFGPLEVAVVVSVWMGFFHRGMLRLNPMSNSVELVGYLHGARWLLPLTLAIVLQERTLVIAVLIAAVAVWLEERRRLITVFNQVCEQYRACA
jgi:hypothetical protein